MFKSTITAAGDAQEVVSKFEAVFKEQASASRVFAVTLATAVGRSETEMLSFLSTLQDTFVPMGFARDKAAELSEQLVTLAIDVASFNDKADADVIRDFQSALVGSTETVRKYGIVITEAGLLQEAFDTGLITTKRRLTEQEKIQLRLNLIMKGTTDAQGDAIRTMDSFNNRMKALESSILDASIAFGEGLLPAATAVAEQLTSIIRSLTILRASTDDYNFANKTLTEQMELVRAEIDANEDAMKHLLGRTLDLQVASQAEKDEFIQLESATKAARLQLEEMEQQLLETTGSIDGQTTAISDQIKMWARLAQKQLDQLGILPDISDAMRDTDRQINFMTGGLKGGKVAADAIALSLDDVARAAGRAAAGGNDVATAFIGFFKGLISTVPIIGPAFALGTSIIDRAQADANRERKFAHGGQFMVGGSGGTDSQSVQFRASPQERVTIETPAQQRASGPQTIIIQIAGRTVATVLAPDLERGAKLGQNNLVVQA